MLQKDPGSRYRWPNQSYKFTVLILDGLIDTPCLYSVCLWLKQAVNIHCLIANATMHQLFFTGDRRMPRWKYFFFFVWGRLFVISHLMLTCKLLRARVTIADDSFVLSPLRLWLLMLWFSWKPLWLRHKWGRERKHCLENTLKAPVLEPVVSLEAVGDFGQNNCYCLASSKCDQLQIQIPCLCFYVRNTVASLAFVLVIY